MLPFNNPAHYGYISPARFNQLFGVLSYICKSKGYLHWQPTEPSVLAACETPRNLLKYIEESTGREFPLEQTNQMWLEYQLLTMAANPQESPGFTGLYCYTQSNRDEKDIASRHPERVMNKRFGMFEIEALIDFEGYLSLMEEILVALGVNKNHIVRISYRSACIALGRNPDLWILNDADEKTLTEKVAPAILLTNFPERTEPFWNMEQGGVLDNGEPYYLKADLLLGGMECAGGAQRSRDKQKQLDRYYGLPGYSETLYNKFGEKTNEELDYYMSLNHIVRSGCGIGLSRLSEGLLRYHKQIQ